MLAHGILSQLQYAAEVVVPLPDGPGDVSTDLYTWFDVDDTRSYPGSGTTFTDIVSSTAFTNTNVVYNAGEDAVYSTNATSTLTLGSVTGAQSFTYFITTKRYGTLGFDRFLYGDSNMQGGGLGYYPGDNIFGYNTISVGTNDGGPAGAFSNSAYQFWMITSTFSGGTANMTVYLNNSSVDTYSRSMTKNSASSGTVTVKFANLIYVKNFGYYSRVLTTDERTDVYDYYSGLL